MVQVLQMHEFMIFPKYCIVYKCKQYIFLLFVNNTYFSYSALATLSSTHTDKKVKKKQKCVIM